VRIKSFWAAVFDSEQKPQHTVWAIVPGGFWLLDTQPWYVWLM
jgi:hypothetical protein